jgi:hypothetical protein
MSRTDGTNAPLNVVLACLFATLGNALVTFVFVVLGISGQMVMLQPAPVAIFTAPGVLIGAGAWALIRRRAKRPASLLRWLVPTVIVLSFVPDLLLLGSPGATVGGVIALMFLHVVAAVIAMPFYQRGMPVTDDNVTAESAAAA